MGVYVYRSSKHVCLSEQQAINGISREHSNRFHHSASKNYLWSARVWSFESEVTFSIVNSTSLQVLRRVALKVVIPSLVTYISLRLQAFDRIQIYIIQDSGQLANLGGETTITLHLR